MLKILHEPRPLDNNCFLSDIHSFLSIRWLILVIISSISGAAAKSFWPSGSAVFAEGKKDFPYHIYNILIINLIFLKMNYIVVVNAV